MPLNKNKHYALAACLFSITTDCAAVNLGVSGEVMYFNYEETDLNGERLNKETGFIPGISITASRPSRRANHQFEFSAYGGDVDYDGQTQAGQPHQTKTEQGIYRLLYRVSAPLETTDAQIYGKVYWQQWDRDIQPNNNVLGLFERYRWWSIEAGIETPLMRRDRSDLLLELGVLTTLNGTMMVDLDDLGFGKPVLDLGQGIGFSGELRYELRQKNNSGFHFGIAFRTWEFGRSNTEIVSDGTSFLAITEPDSQTAQTTLFASYIRRF